MKQQTIYILIGQIGSGKSYWSTNFIKQPKNSQNTVIVNKDKLREMFHGRYKFKPDFEDFIHEISVKLEKNSINKGYNVIIDETNITKERRESWINIIKKLDIPNIKITYVWFTETKNNLDNRMKEPKEVSRKKWEYVIENIKERFEEPSNEELYDELITIKPMDSLKIDKTIVQDKTLPKAIICDLDNTLAFLNGRDPYDASTCYNDKINAPIKNIIDTFWNKGYTIIFCTGRPEQYREATMNFLEKCGYVIRKYLNNKEEVCFLSKDFNLFMRKNEDYRKDSIIKEEIFNEHIKDTYYIDFVLDDRLSVCRMWRNLGLTLLRVGDPDANF